MIDVFTKYVWVKPLEDKKTEIDFDDVTEIINKSKPKPYKLWVDQERGFCNSLMQKWLFDNDILTYS